MARYNQAILIGNLTRSPELKYLPSGTALCKFTVAVSEKYTTKQGEAKEETLFMDCTAWKKAAENVAQFCSKGSPILVEGKLKQERWETQDGQKRSKIVLNVRDFQSLDRQKPDTDRQDSIQSGVNDDDVPF